jgi:hypothetical protein
MKIVEMFGYGARGWEFCIMGKEWYRTNEYCEGLWYYCWNGGYDIEDDGTKSKSYEYKQILGTSQFSVPQSYSGAYKKIRRYFANLINDIDLEYWYNDVKKIMKKLCKN